MEKVSVVMTLYKVEKYVERCLRLVFFQTYPNLEIVAVDDCSPDRSAEVLKDSFDTLAMTSGGAA